MTPVEKFLLKNDFKIKRIAKKVLRSKLYVSGTIDVDDLMQAGRFNIWKHYESVTEQYGHDEDHRDAVLFFNIKRFMYLECRKQNILKKRYFERKEKLETAQEEFEKKEGRKPTEKEKIALAGLKKRSSTFNALNRTCGENPLALIYSSLAYYFLHENENNSKLEDYKFFQDDFPLISIFFNELEIEALQHFLKNDSCGQLKRENRTVFSIRCFLIKIVQKCRWFVEQRHEGFEYLSLLDEKKINFKKLPPRESNFELYYKSVVNPRKQNDRARRKRKGVA